MPPDRASETRRWCYHLVILGIGVAIAGIALVSAISDGRPGWEPVVAAAVGVPLIAVVARFPMLLDNGSGSIEVGFDSSILMFLVCTLDTHDALLVWSAGVVLTQVTTSKTASAKVFNIGIGLLAGGLAAGVLRQVGGHSSGTPRELVAVALAAATYFVTDYVLSGVSVSIYTRTPLLSHLVQRGTVFAIACFVPFDTLGYLGAVVYRTSWWALSLLAVPLVTLLVATRAVTRGREHARRLKVLFNAAVRAQTLSDRDAVADVLLSDAAELLGLRRVRLQETPPRSGEIGVEVQLGEGRRWMVIRALDRARSTIVADEQALHTLCAVASDAVARLELTEEMVHVARHDPLTDLPNRGILLDRVSDALERARRSPTRVALLFMDLDGFKPVNDRFGHAAGDAALVEVAARLRTCVENTTTVARLGGDEFAILVEDTDGVDVPALCQRVLAAVDSGVDVGGQRVPLGASVGLAYGTGKDSPAGLLRNADLAMYEAKARGKGRYVEYEASMGRSRLERLELVDDLRGAIDAGEIDVVYQPVLSVDTGRIVGVEALARWRRDDLPVAPDVFIPAAEENGLIVALGDAVLRRVASDSAALRAASEGDLSISVNISAAQLREPGFAEAVGRAVATMESTALILEITERQGVELDDVVLAAMRAIADMGVVFAIDDFGVGFSSISYLHDLPAQIVKADATLSADVDRDERARALLRSVVLMGSTLGFDVVVEGIERDTQLAIVREDAPSSYAQGYLMHRPMPLHRLLDVMRDERVAEAPAS